MDGALAMDVDDAVAGPLSAAEDHSGGGAADTGALLEILMDDEELDAMAELSETPVAAQISHSQIIEKQAHSIAKLEKHAERAREYKALTKVKLKEAALRLREYRLKVEALLGEVEALKNGQQASEQKIHVLQKTSSGGGGEQIEEPAAITGRGKSGRGRGRGRGGRGRGRGAAGSSEPVASGDDGQKAVVETKSIGTQAETETKSFVDAATQTVAAYRVETAEFGVQAQAEEIIKSVDSGVQTMISGEIQAATAPVVSVSAGFQTDEPDLVDSGCQCDLLTVEESSSVDGIEDEQSSQVSSSKPISARSRSADGDALDEAKARGVSRKRKRSFEMTTGRGGQQPIPSALLLATVVKESDTGADVTLRTHQVGVDVMLLDSEAGRALESDEGYVIDKQMALATEKQRAPAQEVSRSTPAKAVAFGEDISTATSTVLDPVTLPPDRFDLVEMPPSRMPTDEETTAAVLRSPAKQLTRAETRAIDEIGAAIDAELDFSDSDKEELEGGEDQAAKASPVEGDESAALQVALPGALGAAISNGIDSDIDFGSNSDEDNDGSDPVALQSSAVQNAAVIEVVDSEIDFRNNDEDVRSRKAAVVMPGRLVVNDAIGCAIDDELMTSDDDEGPPPTTEARFNAFSVGNDPISAAIDEDLADHSDEDEDEKPADAGLAIPANGDAVSAAIVDELASNSDEERADHGTFEASTSMNAATRDPISAAIDAELASSSDEETEPEAYVKSESKIIMTEKDPIGDAIDDELASSSDDEEVESAVIQLVTKPFSLTSDPIRAAIDDELAGSSSGEEDTEIDANHHNEEPTSRTKNLVASAVDDELGSSSDEEIKNSTPVVTVAAASVTKDPISAAIDGRLGSSSEDEELGNHTDEPSPASTTEICDPVSTADEHPNLLNREKREHNGEEVSEKTHAAGASLLMSMLHRRSANQIVTPAIETSSSTAKDLVDAAIDDELASSSDDAESGKLASRNVAAAGVSASKTTANVGLKSSARDASEISSRSSAASAPLAATALSSKEPRAPESTTQVAAVASTPAIAAAAAVIKTSLPRYLQMGTQSVERDMSDASNGVAVKSNDSHARQSTPAPRDLLAAIVKPSLSLSSSSGSSDSDSSDSGTDSDDEQSQGDFGMEYGPDVADADLSIEAEAVSTLPQAELTRALAFEDAISVPDEKQRLVALGVTSPVIQADIHYDDTEVMEKVPPALAHTADKREPVADTLDKLEDKSGGASSEEEEGEIQSLSAKRRRALSSDQTSQYHDKNSATESGPAKRQKLDGDESLVYDIAASAGKNAAAPPPQAKRDPFAKAMASFQHSIARKDKENNEETDSAFVARTLLVLLKKSAQHAIPKPMLVVSSRTYSLLTGPLVFQLTISSSFVLQNKLRDVLTASYRKKEISPMVLVQETCRVLHVPKVRYVLEKNGLSAWFVAHQILLGLVGVPIGDQEEKANERQIMVAEAEKNQLAECLVFLRSLLSIGRDHLAREANLLTPMDARTQLQWTRVHKNPASHDRVFLSHVCSFYARICKSVGSHEAINVLLFDLLRWYPTIKGLFFTRAIVEVAPEVLRMDFDSRGRQLPVPLLKTTIHHVLAVIDTQSGHKQERILGCSSLQLTHHIAERIHADSLLHVDAEAAAYRESFAAMLWSEHIAPLAKQVCANNTEDKRDAVFEVCKSLELLAAVYMQWQVMELFPVARFQDTFVASEGSSEEGRAAVVKMVGAIALAFTVANNTKRQTSSETTESSSSHASVENYDSSSGDYVLRVCEWLQQLLTQGANSQLESQLACACVLVELVAESAVTRSRRHEMLNQVLQWFQRQPQEQQMRLPGAFLRQLRLVTLSTRPIIKTSMGVNSEKV